MTGGGEFEFEDTDEPVEVGTPEPEPVDVPLSPDFREQQTRLQNLAELAQLLQPEEEGERRLLIEVVTDGRLHIGSTGRLLQQIDDALVSAGVDGLPEIVDLRSGSLLLVVVCIASTPAAKLAWDMYKYFDSKSEKAEDQAREDRIRKETWAREDRHREEDRRAREEAQWEEKRRAAQLESRIKNIYFRGDKDIFSLR